MKKEKSFFLEFYGVIKDFDKRNIYSKKNSNIIPVNLQLFADSGDKTEKATPKKRSKAREEGQVLKSRELTSAVVLLCLFVSLRIFGGYMYNEILKFFKMVLTEYTKTDYFTTNGIIKILIEFLIVFLKILAPIFTVAFLTSLVTEYAQVGFLFTTKTLSFKFSKLNPLSGLKRMFSLRSVTELVKSIAKITVVGLIGYLYVKDEVVNVLNTMDMDVITISAFIGVTVTNVAIRMCIALLIMGVVDFGYQWWEYEKSLKMSKQEIKEEYKQVEGNPEIKSKIKQKQRQISMRRMMQDVPKADVIITNPTHFAVAVKYDAEVSDAPVVLAKGQDYIALRIKEVARESKVEIVENKPLARTLYETVEVGGKIPPDLYQAVAEVLAFVYGLEKNKR